MHTLPRLPQEVELSELTGTIICKNLSWLLECWWVTSFVFNLIMWCHEDRIFIIWADFFFDSCQKVRQTLPNITKHVPTRVGLTPHDSRVHWLILALRVHDFLQFLWFPSNAQKHAGRWVGFAKLPLGVSECLNVCLQCTRSGLVSHLDCILEFEIEIWTGLYSQRPWPG